MKLCKEDGCQSAKAPGRSKCYSHYGKSRRRMTAEMVLATHPPRLRMLFLDIETRPTVAYTWGLFKQNIGVNQIIRPGGMMCFAAKWPGQDEPMQFYSEWQHGQEQMVHEAWRLLNECDVVVHYYGSQFDVKHMNAAFLAHGLTPPAPYKQVDLKLAVSNRFRFPSNKLQFVSQVLGLEGKEEHEGFNLWAKCLDSSHPDHADALSRMESYNRRDVELLEETFEILLPWIPNFPNRQLYTGYGGCPSCGKEGVLEENGHYSTALSVFRRYCCKDCGAWFRSVKREMGVGMVGAKL